MNSNTYSQLHVHTVEHKMKIFLKKTFVNSIVFEK